MRLGRRLRIPGDVRIALAGPRLDRAQIEAFQSRRLREIVRHAYKTVPFYRRLYDEHGVRLDDVRGVEDLARLPMIDKPMMRAVPEADLISSDYSRKDLIRYRTSGSTGVPMDFYRSWGEARLGDLVRRRMAYLHGVTARSRMLQFTAGPSGNDESALQRIGRRLGWFPIEWHDAVSDPDGAFPALKRMQPDVLRSMTSVADRMVQSVGPDAFESVAAKKLMVGGDRLTPAMRRRLESVFTEAVVDAYGTYEFNLLAQQCTLGARLHTCDHAAVVEVLNGETPVPEGERGEVVVTGLHSWAMPLIRYRQGDLAVRGSDGCSCGSALGTIESIEGRVADFIELNDGRRVHFFTLVDGWWGRYDDWIERYQIVQETKTEICLLVQPSRPPSEGEEEILRRTTQEAVGEAAVVRVQVVDQIAPTPMGKYRLAVSRI